MLSNKSTVGACAVVYIVFFFIAKSSLGDS